MPYRENLPANCPPPEAQEVDEPTIFFRLVDQFPPTETDFDSVWEVQPGRRPRLKYECQAKGVSLYDTPEAAEDQTKYETLANKKPCMVKVVPGSGPIRQGTTHHFTWWPLRDHNILNHCSEYTP